MNWLKKYTSGLLHLFFPNTCLLCSKPLFSKEKTVCYRCVSELEPSRIVDFSDNEITQLFEGKVPIVTAFTGFRYHKLGKLQQLIFQLKYHHHKEIGMILGREMGYALENTPFASVDYIIPVPLHPKKQRKRGYNQAEWIAKGLGEVLQKKVRTDILLRNVNTTSQTRKSRMERFENMQEVFSVIGSEDLESKHFLLVDDVVTTGSTLVNCVETLQNTIENSQVSIVCLAKAD